MTSRRRQRNMAKENRKTDYAAQSPKDHNDESVDDMLANVEQFIEGVYRDLSISPPQRASLENTSSSSALPARRSLSEYSPVSSRNTSPVAGASSMYTSFTANATSADMVSPTTRRNMEEEIERINRICDNVDQNLRSIGLYMNYPCDGSIPEDILNSNLLSVSPNSSSTSMSGLTLNSPPLPTVVRNYNLHRSRQRSRSSPMGSVGGHVIDLSDSQSHTPELLRQPLYLNDMPLDDDDDVILISDNTLPVVDLCTPGGHQEVPKSSINRRQLNRRRLSQDDDAADSCCEGPSSSRRRRTEFFTPPEYTKKTTEPSNVNDAASTSSSATAVPGHTPFMCPVCMESCLQRQPTSTRCGHVFCKECIEHAIRLTHKCPMCNSKISRNQIFRIYL